MFWGGIACLLVAFDCARYAVGAQHQDLITAGSLWVWWLPATCWLLNGITLVVRQFSEGI